MNLPAKPITQEDLHSLASARGEEHPGRAWILTPFDTWERNPHYDGRFGPAEKQRHPEDDYEMNQERESMAAMERAAARQSGADSGDF